MGSSGFASWRLLQGTIHLKFRPVLSCCNPVLLVLQHIFNLSLNLRRCGGLKVFEGLEHRPFCISFQLYRGIGNWGCLSAAKMRNLDLSCESFRSLLRGCGPLQFSHVPPNWHLCGSVLKSGDANINPKCPYCGDPQKGAPSFGKLPMFRSYQNL